MAVDETKLFTTVVLGDALARLSTLNIVCMQEDGTMRVFDILAGEIPSAVPGAGNLMFRAMAPLPFRPSDVAVVNDGVDGLVYMRVTDDAGAEIVYVEGVIESGYALFFLADVVFDMPMRDYALTVEVGH